MKDAAYVLGAIFGMVLTGLGHAQICESILAGLRWGGGPVEIHQMLPGLACLLVACLMQVCGCAVYATNRGRSAWFGLWGLLSPIGYVFLSLLTPAPVKKVGRQV
jgi:hypothetical protein